MGMLCCLMVVVSELRWFSIFRQNAGHVSTLWIVTMSFTMTKLTNHRTMTPIHKRPAKWIEGRRIQALWPSQKRKTFTSRRIMMSNTQLLPTKGKLVRPRDNIRVNQVWMIGTSLNQVMNFRTFTKRISCRREVKQTWVHQTEKDVLNKEANEEVCSLIAGRTQWEVSPDQMEHLAQPDRTQLSSLK